MLCGGSKSAFTDPSLDDTGRFVTLQYWTYPAVVRRTEGYCGLSGIVYGVPDVSVSMGFAEFLGGGKICTDCMALAGCWLCPFSICLACKSRLLEY